MRGVRERQGEHADLPVRPPGGVPQVLRQDHPGGRVTTGATAALRHLPHQNRAPQALVARTRHARDAGHTSTAGALRGTRGEGRPLPQAAGPAQAAGAAADQPLSTQRRSVPLPPTPSWRRRQRGQHALTGTLDVLAGHSRGHKSDIIRLLELGACRFPGRGRRSRAP